jgi:nitrogen fixation/metabolism regulation signal transduction histidine kinase
MYLSGGNPDGYLMYAIGEILLVVIGILIALQVNNWNEEWKEKKNQGSSIRFQEEEGNEPEYLPKLLVSTKLENTRVLKSIEDNGPGIPDEIKDKILRPFFTTKKGTEGTGLGLINTHDIIKAHGGEIKIDSKEGTGTHFLIKIPTT